MTSSPLLMRDGAVAADGVDSPVAAHYGSFNREQRMLESGDGFVDLSHRGVVRIAGPDRLSWLHNLTTQVFEDLEPGKPVQALILSPQGHVEHALRGVDDGEAFVAHVEPGTAPSLLFWLDRMRFMTRVELSDISDENAVFWRPTGGGTYDVVPREKVDAYVAAMGDPSGLWAFEALRIARGEPRFGIDTDHRTIPNEVGWIPDAVHLDKGCYRGQETVARVHTLGRPPRRLTLLHIDGTENRLPAHGADITYDGATVGFVGSSARHYEFGPIALGLIKRAVPVDAELVADGMPVTQEVVVDPEVGLHVRPRLRP